MFIQRIINFFKGYVRIRIEGFYIERFINLCISRKILLLKARREKSTILYANIAISDFKRLKKILKKTHTRLKIVKKKGLPFIIHKYRRRKTFVVVFAFVITVMIIASNYIWNIEIAGNVNIDKDDLLKSLEENGLAIGTSKNNLDINEVIRRIRLNRDDIAWIGITVRGTNAIVSIKEVDKAPEVLDKDTLCDIISDKYGIINKISVQNGTAAVGIGDIIEPGTTLVHGFIEGEYTGIRYVHSLATVEARVWYTKALKKPFKQQIEVETGNTENKYRIKFKKNQINLFKTLSKFQKYDTINEEKKIKLFQNFYLPFKIEKITNKEYILKEKIYTEEELTNIIVEELENNILSEIGDTNNIVNTNINTRTDGEYLEVELTIETIENIGIEKEIIF